VGARGWGQRARPRAQGITPGDAGRGSEPQPLCGAGPGPEWSGGFLAWGPAAGGAGVCAALRQQAGGREMGLFLPLSPLGLSGRNFPGPSQGQEGG